MIKNFQDFVVFESEEKITPRLRKSLDKIDVFEDVEDIVDAIEQAGFILLPKKSIEKSCDYAFKDPDSKYIYKSYVTGYIRTKSNEGTWFRPNAKDVGGPTTKARLLNPKDRLLFILRIALKKLLGKSYHEYVNGTKDLPQFLYDRRGITAARKYGF